MDHDGEFWQMWSTGAGNGKLFQHSGLENSMDCIIHGVTKSWTQLSNFHFHTYISHVSFWIRVFIFSEYMPRSGVSGSCSSSVFGFLRMWLHTFDSQYQVCLLPLVPTHLLVPEWASSPNLSWLGPPYPTVPTTGYLTFTQVLITLPSWPGQPLSSDYLKSTFGKYSEAKL